MYIKFTKHGKGSPRKATEYLLNELDSKGEKRPHIEILRGDAQTFVALTEGLDFDYRYTSAIIAWSKEDDPTPEQIQETLDAFEKHAFGGLNPTRYHMNAVLHIAQDGSKHVHILVPRVDLATGKSLNIAPPGHTGYFDKLRNYLNEKHCWSKPDDIALLKTAASLPDHVHAQRAAAKQIDFTGKTRDEKKELLTEIVRQRISAGVINDKKGVVSTLAEFGVITRNNSKTVSVLLAGEIQALRMKGELYKDGFDFDSYAKARAGAEANLAASRKHEINPKRLARLNQRLQKASDARARIFADKYGNTTEVYRSTDSAGLPDLTGQHARKIGISREDDPSISSVAETNARYIHRSPHPEYSTSTTAAAISISTKADNSFSSVMYSIASHSDYNFIGEVNERVKSVSQSASQLSAEANRTAETSFAAVAELQRTVSRAKFAFDARKSTAIQSDFSIERGNIKHWVKDGINQLFGKIRKSVDSTFAKSLNFCFEGYRYSSIGENSYTAANRTTSEATFGTDFETFYTQYKQFKRSESDRTKRASAAAHYITQQLNESSKQIDLMTLKLNHASIKPKPCIELTDYFRKIGYLSPAAKNIHEWSKRQHEAFENLDIEQVTYYIQTKYQEVSSLRRQKQLEPYEIELLQRNIRNDERIIEYMKEKLGCYLSLKEQQRLDRTLLGEKSANEYRLNNVALKDNRVGSLFQKKSKTKNSENESDQDYDLPSTP